MGIQEEDEVSSEEGHCYTKSRDGLFLRRSGVLSLGGSNLKWIKSLEQCSKEVNEVSYPILVNL